MKRHKLFKKLGLKEKDVEKELKRHSFSGFLFLIVLLLFFLLISMVFFDAKIFVLSSFMFMTSCTIPDIFFFLLKKSKNAKEKTHSLATALLYSSMVFVLLLPFFSMMQALTITISSFLGYLVHLFVDTLESTEFVLEECKKKLFGKNKKA